MADHGVFTKYAGMGMLPSYTVEPGASPRELKVTDHPPEDMHRAIAAALDRPSITVLTAVQDVHSAQREQWDDGCNVLAVEPGVVVAYERNVTTNAYLRENGIEVITVARRRTRPRPRRPPLHELPHRARRLTPTRSGGPPLTPPSHLPPNRLLLNIVCRYRVLEEVAAHDKDSGADHAVEGGVGAVGGQVGGGFSHAGLRMAAVNSSALAQ